MNNLIYAKSCLSNYTVLALTRPILEATRSLETTYRRMEEMVLQLLNRQHRIQEQLENLPELAEVDAEQEDSEYEERLSHLELQLDRLHATVFAMQAGAGTSAPILFS